ncbi:DNA-binding response regulator [Azospirillum brasilense]|uniref:Response regulator n=1 Tax=Azospirillum brasilense TaxID=192 RepID=A0A0P0ERB0_AZOBR|nr:MULTISPECIES: response regulator [Azospirillum]ALJ38620.1 two-component system response regulator [Azospirillum brasilense]MDW7553295.1 response regulator [Azospirillum brasilense]MDW7593326.1 response regulator [Azospirillum brasilense]MDW7628614.1 response regulator [Azospirillum brasilense]MDX5955291.1 response regulator [Azospirillum brasilense]
MQADAARTVYVVDDDPAMRHSLGWLIGSLGVAVESFCSGEEFLRAMRADRPGCVVTDVRMPGMSGLELQDTLARAGSVLAVVIITGHGDVPMAARAFRAGAVDVIEKPFNDQLLLDRVHEALEKSRRAWEAQARKAHVRALLARLTPRERQVADLVVQGKPNKVIAAEINLSLKTVEVHRHNVMDKLEVASVSDLTRLLLEAE